jgi:hypothetical protein
MRLLLPLLGLSSMMTCALASILPLEDYPALLAPRATSDSCTIASSNGTTPVSYDGAYRNQVSSRRSKHWGVNVYADLQFRCL